MVGYEITVGQTGVCRANLELALARYDETMALQPITAFSGPARGGVYYQDADNGWLVGTAVSSIRNDVAMLPEWQAIGFDARAVSMGIWVVRSEARQPDGALNTPGYPKRAMTQPSHKFAFWDINAWRVVQAKPDAPAGGDWGDKWEPSLLTSTEHDAIARSVADTRLLYASVQEYAASSYSWLCEHTHEIALLTLGEEAAQKYQALLQPWRGEHAALERNVRTVFYHMGSIWSGVRNAVQGRMAGISSHELEAMSYSIGAAVNLTADVVDTGGPNFLHTPNVHPPFGPLNS